MFFLTNLFFKSSRSQFRTFRALSKSRLLDEEQTSFFLYYRFSNISRYASKLSSRKNSCVITRRKRGLINKFQLSRLSFKELASRGLIFGLKKSRW